MLLLSEFSWLSDVLVSLRGVYSVNFLYTEYFLYLVFCLDLKSGTVVEVTEVSRGFPVTQLVKIRLQCRRPEFDPWIGKISWRRERLPAPVFWPEDFHGLYSPWGCKEDTTE